jgi:type I restriction-modification system DNA methylase subunit
MEYILSSLEEALIQDLGYVGQPGFIDTDLKQLKTVGKNRFILDAAYKTMSVFKCFGLWGFGEGNDSKPFTPLVYLAKSGSFDEAELIHRKVWSQGSVPFLLIFVEDSVLYCNGFNYSSKTWRDDIDIISLASNQFSAVAHLKAYKLKSSITWRDYALDSRARVDAKLLGNLENLNAIFTDGINNCPKLDSKIANALIGKFLYLYMLYDRGIITDNWITQVFPKVKLDDATHDIAIDQFWGLFDHIDKLFNGSIFPLKASERSRIKKQHMQLLRDVIRHDCLVTNSGTQLSFFDFHFGSIQTETLSAVYEKFLETESADKKRQDGAFYTPPFLVDYIVDKVDELCNISKGTKVLDPSAGSGAFLVAALRKIIEKELFSSDSEYLSPSRLRNLLSKNIFAIEKNISACNVSAFSCYITMLDYVSPKEIKKIVKGESQTPLFPKLIGINILNQDFFDDTVPEEFPKKFDCIIGNPPWQKIDEISESFGIDFMVNNDAMYPVDQREAAELFAWKVTMEKLSDAGVSGLLLPTKSFISPSAKKFSNAFAKSVNIVGIANFSHFRYKLFADARQPALAVITSNKAPEDRTDLVWVYSPLLTGLPIGLDGQPWVIIEDKAEVRKFDRNKIFSSPRDLFEAVILRPIDHKILDYVSDKVASGFIQSIGDLLSKTGLKISRGGSPVQTGLPSDLLLGGDKYKSNYFKTVLGLDHAADLVDFKSTYKLKKSDLEKVNPNFQKKFGGNILVIPRSMKKSFFIENPIAYNSSLNSIYCDDINPEKIQLLKALEKYLNSNVIKYFFSIFGKLWIIDKARLEVEDLKLLPIPICNAQDENILRILNCDEALLDDLLMEIFDFDFITKKALYEYFDFRRKFEDGQVPKSAYELPNESIIDRYKDILLKRLSSFIFEDAHFQVTIDQNQESKMGIVEISYIEDIESKPLRENSNIAIATMYNNLGVSIFTDSSYIDFNTNDLKAYIIKPLENCYWTVEKAFDESRVLLQRYIA